MVLEKALKYYELAKFNANLFSKDPNRKVGAIIISNDFTQILSTGINGFPRKFNDDNKERWERPTKYIYVAHAESNSICNAARSGVPINNCIMITTMFPCYDCSKLIIQSGIKEIYTIKPDFDNTNWSENFKISLEMLNEANIKISYLD